MKKLIFLGSAITSLLMPVQVLAQNIRIEKPSVGFGTIGDFITKAIQVVIAVSILIVLIMLIIGAFEWITSGGDKEAVAKARNRIINALIGLAVLAVAFALARLGAQFAGVNLQDIFIPAPSGVISSPGPL